MVGVMCDMFLFVGIFSKQWADDEQVKGLFKAGALAC